MDTKQSKKSNDSVQWELPPEKEGPHFAAVKKQAGGLPAVASSLQHSIGKMGTLRAARTLLKVNQKNGFDCPGCAWPDPDDRRAMTEFCENGAKALAEEATRKKIGPQFFETWSVLELSKESDYWLGQQGRLTRPMLLDKDASHYREVTWEEAFTLVSQELKALENPDQAIFYTSGRTSNEAAFLYQLMVRLFGTNNLPDCSNMCHESSGVALTETIGIGKGTVTLDDFEKSDLIIVMGQNPGTNHPRMLSTLQKAARRGASILSVNPLFEAGTRAFSHPQEVKTWLGSGATPLASLHLPVKINGDVALLKGWMKCLVEKHRSCLDLDFIQNKTSGVQDFMKDLKQESWDLIVEQSGLSLGQIEESAALIAQGKNIIVCWAMGLTQHENAVANIQSIVNMMLLRGQLGRSGAGLCPVRGHSNVQGDRTMGIWEKPPAWFLDRLSEAFKFEAPRKAGYDTVAAIEAMRDRKAKVFVALGGNFLSAAPDTEATAKALQNCRLTVQVSTKLNRSHLITGRRALILPCLGRSEKDKQAMGLQFVTVENSMGIVHASRGNLSPASSFLKSEVAIVCELARRLFPESRLPWELWKSDYRLIREKIEAVIPGFENYNSRIDENGGGGFYLPNPVRDQQRFATSDGKAHFTVHSIPCRRLEPGQYLMMTIRSHDQFNTTIYGLDDRYRGVLGGRRVLLMNQGDMLQAGLQSGQKVDLESHFEGQKRHAAGFKVQAYDIPSGCLASYFPEANSLVPLGQKAHKSHTPASKSVVVTLRPANVNFN